MELTHWRRIFLPHCCHPSTMQLKVSFWRCTMIQNSESESSFFRIIKLIKQNRNFETAMKYLNMKMNHEIDFSKKFQAGSKKVEKCFDLVFQAIESARSRNWVFPLHQRIARFHTKIRHNVFGTLQKSSGRRWVVSNCSTTKSVERNSSRIKCLFYSKTILLWKRK